MGCGSSTQVETFKNPEENKTNQTQRNSNSPPVQENTRPSSRRSKASSRSSSASSKCKDKVTADSNAGHRSRNSSANTKRTYTLENNHEGNDPIIENKHEQENDQSHLDNVTQYNVAKTNNDIDNISEEEVNDKTYENKADTQSIDSEPTPVTNILDEDERIILENGLCALDIPEVDETKLMKNFTIDDIIDDRSLFKYGRKVYSNDIMQPIIQERLRQFSEYVMSMNDYVTHPVSIARGRGITRKELKQLLPVCQVGNFVDPPRDQYLSRMKQDVESILEPEEDEDPDSEYITDFKQQLLRWLQKYPSLYTENQLPDYKTDPNYTTFPICIDDPSLFQKWIVEWETFDTVVPDSGAWQSYEFNPIHNPSLAPQVHEHFASIIKLREDASIEDLDMTIDGEAAWFVIEIDIVKNDSTTEEQEKTWSLREKRSNLNDPEWMDRRRKELADQILNRHKYGNLDPETMGLYLDFATHLDENWKMFQELCDKEFNPPKRYKILYTMAKPGCDEANNIDAHSDNGSGQANNEDAQSNHVPEQANNEDAQSNDAPQQANNEDAQSNDAPEQANNEDAQSNDAPEQANNEDAQSNHVPEQANNEDAQSKNVNDQNNDKDALSTDGDERENDMEKRSNIENEQTNIEDQKSDPDANNMSDSVNDNTGHKGGANSTNDIDNTPAVPNGEQQIAERPTIETMDSGLELDTPESFYK